MINLQSMLELEKQHLDSEVRSSPEQLGSLLCDEFLEFGSSGKVWHKAEILSRLAKESGATEFHVNNYQICKLGEEHILATYVLEQPDGNLTKSSLRSTVWKRVDNNWRMLFHQGTSSPCNS